MSNNELIQPRAVIGGNTEQAPDYGTEVAARLKSEYGEVFRTLESLLEEGRQQPRVTDNVEVLGIKAKIIQRVRDLRNRMIAIHKKEKEPFLRGGEAVDSTFFTEIDRCERRPSSKAKPGIVDVLTAENHDYNERVLAAEKLKRDQEAAAARAEEKRIADEKAAAEKIAAEAAAKAARARNADNVAKLQKEAAEAQAKADALALTQESARDTRQEADANAAAKPADMVRVQVAEGVTNTMKRVGYCEVAAEDVDKLPMDILWAHVKDDAKIAAAKDWAKLTQYKRELPGASIGFRNKTVTR